MTNKILCFGEMLWDVFPKEESKEGTPSRTPDHEKPGGAPMNVALHLQKLGSHVSFMSSCANDDRGNRLTAYLQSNGLSTDFIQTSNYPTGTVNIAFNEKREHTFEIVAPSAWDHIVMPNEPIEPAVLVYGSLACRNEVTYHTLQQLLKLPCTTVFDVNFRQPFVDRQKTELLLSKANWVKMNDEELIEIGQWYGHNRQTLQELAHVLAEQFGIDTLCITKGAEGAFIVEQQKVLEQAAPQIKVGDTVGAGDAFLAGLLHQAFTEQTSLMDALSFAVKIGAYVASKHGANPAYTVEDIPRLA